MDKLRKIRRGKSTKFWNETYGTWAAPDSPDFGNLDFDCYQSCGNSNETHVKILGDLKLLRELSASNTGPVASSNFHSMYRRATLNHLVFLPYQLDLAEVDYRSFYYVDRAGVYRLGNDKPVVSFAAPHFDGVTLDFSKPYQFAKKENLPETGEALGMAGAGNYLVVSRDRGRLMVVNPHTEKIIFDENITEQISDFNGQHESFPLVVCACESSEGRIHVLLQSTREHWTEVETKILRMMPGADERNAQLYYDTMLLEKQMEKDRRKEQNLTVEDTEDEIDGTKLRKKGKRKRAIKEGSGSDENEDRFVQETNLEPSPPESTAFMHKNNDTQQFPSVKSSNVHTSMEDTRKGVDNGLNTSSAAKLYHEYFNDTNSQQLFLPPTTTMRPKCLRTSVLTLLTIEKSNIETKEDESEDDREDQYEISWCERLYSSFVDIESIPAPQHATFASIDGIPLPPSSMIRLVVWANYPYSSDRDKLYNPHIRPYYDSPQVREQSEDSFLTVLDTEGLIKCQHEVIMSGRCRGGMDPDLTIASGRPLICLERGRDILVYEVLLKHKGITLKHVGTYDGMKVILDTEASKSVYLSADASYLTVSLFEENVKVYLNPLEKRRSGIEHIFLYEIKKNEASGDDPQHEETTTNHTCDLSKAARVIGVKLVPMSHSLISRPQPQLLCVLTKEYARFFRLKMCRRPDGGEEEKLADDTGYLVERLVNLGGEGEW